MTERERLIELLKVVDNMRMMRQGISECADYILADGWIRPPCKCGDTVYYFSNRPFNISVEANTVYEAEVVRIVTTRLGTQLVIQIRNKYGCTEVPDVRAWGKTVFPTREEAVKALKGGEADA